jgi:glucan 1,3-beta-glucosidase
MLGNDYDSVHQLAGYGDKEAIPMQGYNDKEDRSSMLTPRPDNDHDYRSAGIAKYGLAADLKKSMSPKKKWTIFAIIVAILIIIAVAVAVPLLTLHKNVNNADSSSAGPGTGPDGKVLTAGGNGTVIRMANGTTFTYINSEHIFFYRTLSFDADS